METWGISGPLFIQLYLGAAVLLVLVGVVWAWSQGRRSAVAGAGHGLDAYHLAYLAGGRRRVVESAVAALLNDNRLRVSSKGRLTACGQPAPDRMQASVRDAASGKYIRQVVPAMREKLRPLVDDLVRRGLVVPESAVRSRRTVILLLWLALLVLGIARLVSGSSHNRPVGYLTVALIPVVIGAAVAFNRRKRDAWQTTTTGKRLLDEVRSRKPGRQGAIADPAVLAIAGAGVLGAVAVGGLTMFPDHATSAALTLSSGNVSGGGGGGGSSCGSSCGGGGSSCGGGGCGGGGCGG